MLMCTRPLVVFWWLRKNYWSYRKNNYIFGILTKFYLRKVTSYFTCRAIRGLIFSKLPPIDWSVLRSTIWNGRRYYALRCSVTCQGFSYSLISWNHSISTSLLSINTTSIRKFVKLKYFKFFHSPDFYIFSMYKVQHLVKVPWAPEIQTERSDYLETSRHYFHNLKLYTFRINITWSACNSQFA